MLSGVGRYSVRKSVKLCTCWQQSCRASRLIGLFAGTWGCHATFHTWDHYVFWPDSVGSFCQTQGDMIPRKKELDWHLPHHLTCSLWGGQLASVQGEILKLCSHRSWWGESQGWNAGSKTQGQRDQQAPFNPSRQRSKLCIWELSQQVSTYLSQRGWEEVCCKLTRPAFWLTSASVKRMTLLKLQGHSCRSWELIGRP